MESPHPLLVKAVAAPKLRPVALHVPRLPEQVRDVVASREPLRAVKPVAGAIRASAAVVRPVERSRCRVGRVVLLKGGPVSVAPPPPKPSDLAKSA